MGSGCSVFLSLTDAGAEAGPEARDANTTGVTVDDGCSAARIQ